MQAMLTRRNEATEMGKSGGGGKEKFVFGAASCRALGHVMIIGERMGNKKSRKKPKIPPFRLAQQPVRFIFARRSSQFCSGWDLPRHFWCVK